MKRYLPLIVILVAAASIAATLLPPRNPGDYNINGFGRLPVLVNGRIKPFDTVARASLLTLQNRQRVVTPDGRSLQPIEWLLDVFFRPDVADTYQTFVIDNPDLLTVFGLRPEDGLGKRRFSFNQIARAMPELQRQAQLADPVDAATRSGFQRAVVSLRDRVVRYQQLKYALVPPDVSDFLGVLVNFEQQLPAARAAVQAMQAGEPHDEAAAQQLLNLGESFLSMEQASDLLPIPPAQGADPANWKKAGQALRESFATGRVHPYSLVYAGLAQTWRNNRSDLFNGTIERYAAIVEPQLGDQAGKVAAELRFNSAAPFYTGIWIFGFAGFAGILAWLFWPEGFRRIAFSLIAMGWLLTTTGILTRMWLESRPPVTNLYSSALYVGWGAVALCLILEWIYKNAVGSVAAGAIGFATLLIAHHLSFAGDTLEMMQAVLDSNFWLATHVVMITTGYSATFLAGFLALIYVFRGLFTKSLNAATAHSLTRMVYGIVCFATLFSLVGTILGGIWADQSWGRFWGWDPKENGALMIVIWNAIFLHARWGGLVKARGMMNLAIGGNIVTAWSWFGVNMLGVGLHSYGFTDAAFRWLTGFVLSQLLIIGLASMPLEKWRSFRKQATEVGPAAKAQA